MHEHPVAAVEVEDQVLPSPPDILEPTSHQLRGPRRHGLERGELQEVEALERRSPDGFVYPLGERLDLGHLGHAQAFTAVRMISIASSIRSRCVRWLTMHARMMWRPSIVVLER